MKRRKQNVRLLELKVKKFELLNKNLFTFELK